MLAWKFRDVQHLTAQCWRGIQAPDDIGSWVIDIGGLDDLRHPQKNTGAKKTWRVRVFTTISHFPKHHIVNLSRNKQKPLYYWATPYSVSWKDNKKTTTFGRNLDPKGELKHQQSCKKIPQRNTITKTSIAILHKRFKTQQNQYHPFKYVCIYIYIYVYIYLHNMLHMLLIHSLCMYFSRTRFE